LRKLALTTMLCAALCTVGQTAQASNSRTLYQQALRAVCFYFGPNCATAMKIVNCETGGTYTPWSANGQYLGIFQMGSHERAIYGYGNNVWAQAKAAYAYFKAGGYSFGPWLNYEPPGCAS